MIKLRWQPNKPDWLVCPDSPLSDARPFRICSRALVDPQLFNLVAFDHGWQRVDPARWRETVQHALVHGDLGDFDHEWLPACLDRAEWAIQLMDLSDDPTLLEETLAYFDALSVPS